APGPDHWGAYHGQPQIPAGTPGSFALKEHQVRWYLEATLGPRLRRAVRYPVTVEAASGPSPVGLALGQPRREEARAALWIDAEAAVFEPGDTLRGGCEVRPVDGGRLRTVELSVLWHTAPPGSREVGVCLYQEYEAVEGARRFQT